MVGDRQYVSWGLMVTSPTRSLGEWLRFRQLPEAAQSERLMGMRGSTRH